jgi:histidinol phosphatase-like PHP family hydrolase
MFFPILYAETHYKLPWLIPRYFRKFPECIADIPIRLFRDCSEKLPVLIVIKDSDKFPVKLLRVDVIIRQGEIHYSEKFISDIELSIPYYSEIFHTQLNANLKGLINVTVRMEFETAKGLKIVHNDSYPNMKYEPLVCDIQEENIIPQNWYAGDIHYHSNHTNDQVEFGADIPATAIMAKAMGLSWFAVTDHSYDLDDTEDNYLNQTTDYPKWQRMCYESRKYSDENLSIIPGEEASVGNLMNKNIHLLMLNNQNYVSGSGDGAEDWLKVKPEFKHFAAIKYGNPQLAIPAHPFEEIPYFQNKLLNRGDWQVEDFEKMDAKIIQPFNNNDPKNIQKNLEKWITLLLQGKRLLVTAGNDAHGGFNFAKQITIPFWKIVSSRNQIFGQLMTIVNNSNLIEGLKSGKMIVSNGGFLNFSLHSGEQSFTMNDQVNCGTYTLNAERKCIEKLLSITVFVGNLKTQREDSFNFEQGMKLNLYEIGYVRMEMKTENNGIAITNPIWIVN